VESSARSDPVSPPIDFAELEAVGWVRRQDPSFHSARLPTKKRVTSRAKLRATASAAPFTDGVTSRSPTQAGETRRDRKAGGREPGGQGPGASSRRPWSGFHQRVLGRRVLISGASIPPEVAEAIWSPTTSIAARSQLRFHFGQRNEAEASERWCKYSLVGIPCMSLSNVRGRKTAEAGLSCQPTHLSFSGTLRHPIDRNHEGPCHADRNASSENG